MILSKYSKAIITSLFFTHDRLHSRFQSAICCDDGRPSQTSEIGEMICYETHTQVVLSPHVYGPSVTHSPDRWAGIPLFQRLSDSFGWATREGG